MTDRDPLAGLERALSAGVSRVLLLDAALAARLARLEGSVLEIHVRDTGWRAFALPGADGVRVLRRHAGRVDVRISGRPADFVAYARASRRGDSLGAGRIEISGDLAVAQQVQALLADLAIDWEDVLAQAIGDVPAHQLARALRASSRWAADAGARLERDLADYLHHEARLAPTRAETEALARAIFAAADDVERLEARLRRLRARPSA
jgi:ubiquinone biosynthesis protein UbiJ